MSKSKIRAEDKIRIAKACSEGEQGIREAAAQMGVHRSVVDDWVR